MSKTVEELVAERVKEELEPIDVKSLYNAFLDEQYDFESVCPEQLQGVKASEILEQFGSDYEYNMGQYSDSLLDSGDYVEIEDGDELYDAKEVEKIRDEIQAEIYKENNIRDVINNPLDHLKFASTKSQEYPADNFTGYWLHINERGNTTLYDRVNGEDYEIWSRV